VRVDHFEISAHEKEFGRHIALFHDLADFDGLKQRLSENGAELIEPLRETPHQRFFFETPEGYVFEVIEKPN
jgi:predicted enzyme related to lactoylglutathione lyase